MERMFIEIPLFTKRWSEIGLTADDLLDLQLILLENPQAGDMMQGTGGIRKVRLPLEHKGKSGGVRVCYTDFEEYELIFLITAFTKAEQENLTDDQMKTLRKLVKALKDGEAQKRRYV